MKSRIRRCYRVHRPAGEEVMPSISRRDMLATAAALVEIDPGGLREMHWHPNADEWQYYIEGQGRMGVFGASSQTRTFDFEAGDVGYVPFAMGHYIENAGTTPLRFRVADASRTNKTPVVPATFETATGKPGSPYPRPPAE
jgi:oxalate decarboxylase/phosphoglucose isomerase-like protein (cupin superfamily)